MTNKLNLTSIALRGAALPATVDRTKLRTIEEYDAAAPTSPLAAAYTRAARHDAQHAADLAAGRTGDPLVDRFRDAGVLAYRHDSPEIKTAFDPASDGDTPVVFLPADGSYDHIAWNWVAATSAFRLRSTLDLERQKYRPAKGNKRR